MIAELSRTNRNTYARYRATGSERARTLGYILTPSVDRPCGTRRAARARHPPTYCFIRFINLMLNKFTLPAAPQIEIILPVLTKTIQTIARKILLVL